MYFNMLKDRSLRFISPVLNLYDTGERFGSGIVALLKCWVILEYGFPDWPTYTLIPLYSISYTPAGILFILYNGFLGCVCFFWKKN